MQVIWHHLEAQNEEGYMDTSRLLPILYLKKAKGNFTGAHVMSLYLRIT